MDMTWQELLRKRSIASLEALAERFGAEHVGDIERLKQAAENFEFRISPAMVDLIREPGDPIWRQYVPTARCSSSRRCAPPTAASAPGAARWAIPRRSRWRTSNRPSST